MISVRSIRSCSQSPHSSSRNPSRRQKSVAMTNSVSSVGSSSPKNSALWIDLAKRIGWLAAALDLLVRLLLAAVDHRKDLLARILGQPAHRDPPSRVGALDGIHRTQRDRPVLDIGQIPFEQVPRDEFVLVAR